MTLNHSTVTPDRAKRFLSERGGARTSDLRRSASYDPVWMLENLMGPNAVWLAEALSQILDLPAGMRMASFLLT